MCNYPFVVIEAYWHQSMCSILQKQTNSATWSPISFQVLQILPRAMCIAIKAHLILICHVSSNLLSFGVNQLEWGKRLLNPKTFSYFNINGAEIKTYQWGEWIYQTRFHVFTRWKQSWRWHQRNVKIVRIRRWGTFVKCWWFTHLT